MKALLLAALVISPVAAGCAKTSVLDVDSNTVMISTSAAPACGQQGAQDVAAQRAAVETLKRGYDRYVILGAHADSNVGVVGYTPQVANTYSTATSMHTGTQQRTADSQQPI